MKKEEMKHRFLCLVVSLLAVFVLVPFAGMKAHAAELTGLDITADGFYVGGDVSAAVPKVNTPGVTLVGYHWYFYTGEKGHVDASGTFQNIEDASYCLECFLNVDPSYSYNTLSIGQVSVLGNKPDYFNNPWGTHNASIHGETSDLRTFSYFSEVPAAPAGGSADGGSSVSSKPLTPEEIYQNRLDKDYPFGNAYVGPGKDACFMEAGNDGSAVHAWKSGESVGSFTVKDAAGAAVKTKLLGQKVLDGKYYISISAYSKVGGLTVVISDADKAALKAKGISGILLDGKKSLMEF